MSEIKKPRSIGIFKRGQKVSTNFIGTAWIEALVSDDENVYDCQVYNIVFEPNTRSHWHKHPGGQILLVIEGTGYYQERGEKARILKKGDVVEIPLDTEHWYGATFFSRFTYISITPNINKGLVVWLKPVSDEEYKYASKASVKWE